MNRELFRRKIELQAKKLMKKFKDWDLEVLFPITRKGIDTSVKFIGTRHETYIDDNEVEDEVIGWFHTHPFGICEFSRADIRTALAEGRQVIAVGVPQTGEVKVLFRDEFPVYRRLRVYRRRRRYRW